jgi:hypothetical protein
MRARAKQHVWPHVNPVTDRHALEVVEGATFVDVYVVTDPDAIGPESEVGGERGASHAEAQCPVQASSQMAWYPGRRDDDVDHRVKDGCLEVDQQRFA